MAITATGRGLRPGGVVRALGRLSLLISFGFAAGLLIGVLLEEPKLLAGHLRGEGEAVVLAATAETSRARTPSPSKPPGSSVEVERKALMEARASERPEKNLPVVAAAAAKLPAHVVEDHPWAIQVGAFADEAAAARLVVVLDAKGYRAELIPSTDGSKRWRVRVQPVRSRASAQEMAGSLKRVEGLPTWVLPMEGRPR